MRKPEENTTRNTHKGLYTYEYSAAPEHGKRTIRVVVTTGELKGKSALVIKMPDQFSGFFPEVDPNIHSCTTRSPTENNGIAKGSSGHS